MDFIRSRLDPGGAVCYLDCGAKWLRSRVGERSVFQVGGWGGISAQEFLEGSERLSRYCREARLPRCDWRLPGFPLEEGPESEWGCEPGLGEALQDFCLREGYRFIKISLPEPHDYSRLAFQAMARLLEEQGRTPGGVLVEMFSQFDVTAALQAGLLPLWLVFNTADSLAFLQEMVPLFPKDRPVFFSPLSTFTLTPDIVPWPAWEEALRGLDWRNIGARPSPAAPLGRSASQPGGRLPDPRAAAGAGRPPSKPITGPLIPCPLSFLYESNFQTIISGHVLPRPDCGGIICRRLSPARYHRGLAARLPDLLTGLRYPDPQRAEGSPGQPSPGIWYDPRLAAGV
jgi:hypothetical protein